MVEELFEDNSEEPKGEAQVRLGAFKFTLVKQFIQTVYLRTTVEQLVEEVFELLMEFKPFSDKSVEPVERSRGVSWQAEEATKSAVCVAVACQKQMVRSSYFVCSL